jgi:hypothetical protein
MIGVLKGSIKKYIKIENLYIRNKISMYSVLIKARAPNEKSR